MKNGVLLLPRIGFGARKWPLGRPITGVNTHPESQGRRCSSLGCMQRQGVKAPDCS